MTVPFRTDDADAMLVEIADMRRELAAANRTAIALCRFGDVTCPFITDEASMDEWLRGHFDRARGRREWG